MEKNKVKQLLTLVFAFFASGIVFAQHYSFKEENGLVAMEAEYYTSKKGGWYEVEGRNALIPQIIGYGSVNQIKVIPQLSHPICGNRNDTIRIAKDGYRMPFAYVLPSAIKVATISGDQDKAVVFTYHKGDDLLGFKAPDKRAGVFMANRDLSSDGWMLLMNTVKWAAGDGKNILYVANNENLKGADELFVEELKNQGFVVKIVFGKTLQPQDYAGFHAAILSDFVRKDAIHDKLKHAAIPVVVCKYNLLEIMGMAQIQQPWQPSAGQSGNAMMISSGNWNDHLQYAIYFDNPGEYTIWLLGKNGGDGGADEVKVFFNTREINSNHPDFFEIKFPRELGWTNEMYYKTPENRETKGNAIIKVSEKDGITCFWLRGPNLK
jgi:hypothetical protein